MFIDQSNGNGDGLSFNNSRRRFLQQASMGFGWMALSGMWGEDAEAKVPETHFPAKAKSVIFLFMDGGVSQVDTFDPKPQLDKEHGQKPKFKTDPTVFNAKGNLMKSPWAFKQHGQSGTPISDLFPYLGTCADELCVIRSMTAFSANHPNAVYGIHTGHALLGWPSMGAWTSYGLGSMNKNLPSFVVLHGGLTPNGGVPNFGSGFLPSNHSGSVLTPGKPMRNISRKESADAQEQKLRRLREIDGDLLGRLGHAPQVESAIRNHELAFRMQMEVPEAMELSGETEATKQMYGFDSKWGNTRKFATQCLLARRMVERGVRFIELTTSGGNGDRWDQHGNIRDGHQKNALSVDQPIAALIQDLRQRGLLDSTLLVFSGEFGRTPFAQGSGRDHNPQGFSIWMAGGGVQKGNIYGATDEYGYRVVENKLTVHDMHANMLHLLGINHKKLTVRFSGRDMRLTDVHGRIVPEIVGSV
jgi:hypothetical protein